MVQKMGSQEDSFHFREPERAKIYWHHVADFQQKGHKLSQGIPAQNRGSKKLGDVDFNLHALQQNFGMLLERV